MNFAWSLFEFTMVDCQLLAKALKATPTLKVLRLTQSKATDERGRLLVAHLLDHPSLHTLGKHGYTYTLLQGSHKYHRLGLLNTCAYKSEW